MQTRVCEVVPNVISGCLISLFSSRHRHRSLCLGRGHRFSAGEGVREAAGQEGGRRHGDGGDQRLA